MGYWGLKIAKMFRIVFLISISLIAFGCDEKNRESIKLPYYNEPDFTPFFIRDAQEVQDRITHTIRDFSLLNQDSILITQQVFDNKIHVANFIFTSCGSICPVMTKNLKTVHDFFKNDTDLVFLSFSVTPWIDKPFRLKKYSESNDAVSPGWHFLTGSKSDIYQLARQSYFAEEDIGFSKDSSAFLHTEHFVLVDKTKRIRGVYNGTLELEMHHLVADIKSLKNENE
jgi:protein SCO1/2